MGKPTKFEYLPQDVLDAAGFGELHGLVLEVKHDLGSTGLIFRNVDGVTGSAVAGPEQAFAFGLPGAGEDLHFVGHHEGGVEANAKLADELATVVFLAALFECLNEGLGAGVGDGAEVFHQFLTGEAQAVIGKGEGLGFFVHAEMDLQREVGHVDGGFALGELDVLQLLLGI